MKLIEEPITGEKKIVDESVDTSIHEVLENFYHAFNRRDFNLMQENWANSDEIAMDNPLGGIKRGWSEIKEVYKRIFSGEARVYVEFYDYSIVEFEGGFCAIGRERGSVKIKDKHLELAIRTSRIYKKIQGEYKQVHHHGSIEDAQLLAQYQKFVK